VSLDTEITGEPASIRSASTWLRDTLAPALDGSIDALNDARKTAASDWQGATGSAFAGAMSRGVSEVDPIHAGVQRVAGCFDDFAGSLQSCQGRMESIRGAARAAGLTVAGFVIQDPGAGPAHPGEPPEFTSQGQLDSWNRVVAAYNEHQEKIRAYNQLAQRVEEVWNDIERAWERVSSTDRALDAASWTFSLSDVAGGLGGALRELDVSILRKDALHFKGMSDSYLARLRATSSVPPNGAAQFYDDLDHWKGVGQGADDTLSAASRAARVAKVAPIAAGGLLALGGTYYDYQYGGESIEQAAASNLGGFAASVGTGALIGTAIGGPVGTAVGAVVGAGVGVFTSGMIDGLWENNGDVSDAFMSGVDTVVDTGEALVDVGGSIVDGIGGLFD
jgi:hypothetical protein